MKKEDKEAQQLVKRLAEFLGLEAVERKEFGFKPYIVIRYKRWREQNVWIRGSLANCISWKDALHKFLGAKSFRVYPKIKNLQTFYPKSEPLQIVNPFFEMSPEEACLHLDLLAPR